MKPSMAIKPLVFAIAAVMAVAVQAGQEDNHHRHDRGHDHDKPKQQQVNISANASATDTQMSTGNYITNQGTKNNAKMSDSVQGNSGNVGVNVAAGDGNQQDNAAAIANAQSDSSAKDNSFVFGDAKSTAKVTQTSSGNYVWNQGSESSAVVTGSITGGSGNLGVNVAGGDLNQQKNTMAIANSNAPMGNATATASATQTGPGLVVYNGADRQYRVDTISLTSSVKGSQSFKEAEASYSASAYAEKSASAFKAQYASNSKSDSSWKSASASDSHASVKANLDANVDVDTSHYSYNGWHHSSGGAGFDADVDASLNASIDTSHKSSNSGSHSASNSASGSISGSRSQSASGSEAEAAASGYSESSSFDLSRTVSYQVLTPDGWKNPVTNTATLSGSVVGSSGNLGVNVASGVGNQQSNSLAISNNSM
jgi:hypothetical protein